MAVIDHSANSDRPMQEDDKGQERLVSLLTYCQCFIDLYLNFYVAKLSPHKCGDSFVNRILNLATFLKLRCTHLKVELCNWHFLWEHILM